MLDIPRRPGWLGGVCAGIAYRLGIDPLIVRGIAVVIAVLGGPVFLLYSAAWLLLPDLEGRIHLQRLFEGIFDRALVGIVAVFVVGLLPVAQGFWALSAGYWGDASVFGAVQRAFWTLIIIAGAIAATIWIARATQAAAAAPVATPATPAASPASSPATTDDRPETIPTGETAGAPAAAPTEPVAPAAGASEEQISAWREQQAAWKIQFDAWKAAQAADAKEQRLRRQAEARTRAAEAAAASAERRRIRRLNNPRLGGSLTAMVLGVALLAGGIAAVIATGSSDWQGAEVATGLAVATITVGLGIVVAGAFKRKAGFLGFVSVLLVFATVIVGFVPRDRQVIASIDGYGLVTSESGRWAQLNGSVRLSLITTDEPIVIDLWQGTGSVAIDVPDDVSALVEIHQQDASNSMLLRALADESGADKSTLPLRTHRSANGSTFSHKYGSGPTEVTVRVWQGAGTITIRQPLATIPNEGTNQ